MIINPDKEGCTIWEGNRVQHIKGRPAECCAKIAQHVFEVDADKTLYQWCDVLLDAVGIGSVYASYLTNRGVRFTEVTYGGIIP